MIRKIACLVTIGLIFSGINALAADSKKEAAALSEAEKWLALVDSKKICWELGRSIWIIQKCDSAPAVGAINTGGAGTFRWPYFKKRKQKPTRHLWLAHPAANMFWSSSKPRLKTRKRQWKQSPRWWAKMVFGKYPFTIGLSSTVCVMMIPKDLPNLVHKFQSWIGTEFHLILHICWHIALITGFLE